MLPTPCVKSAGGRCQDVPKLPGIGCLSLVPYLDAVWTRNRGIVPRPRRFRAAVRLARQGLVNSKLSAETSAHALSQPEPSTKAINSILSRLTAVCSTAGSDEPSSAWMFTAYWRQPATVSVTAITWTESELVKVE